jgi:hypothetical protein
MRFFGYGCHDDGPLAQPKEVVMARIALCDARGLLIDTIEKLSGDDGDRWADRLKQALRESVSGLLQLINPKIKVSAHESFVVADNFKKGVAGIYDISDNFSRWFGSKVEKDISSTTLVSRKLTRNSVDGSIKAELGESHEVFLTWLFEMIEAQADGRDGELIVNGYVNIFYIDGYAVSACGRTGHGWSVGAYEVTNPNTWDAGSVVFSRNSVLEPLEVLV